MGWYFLLFYVFYTKIELCIVEGHERKDLKNEIDNILTLILNDAIIDSEKIIEHANIKAKQIACSAFEVKVLWIKTITKPLDYNEEICKPLHPKGGGAS